MNMTQRLSALVLAGLALLSFQAMAQTSKPFETNSLDAIVAQHKGKPFLLLVWSMDCEFCQASLDNLARARAAHPGLEIVTVSTDPVSDKLLDAQIEQRLSSLSLSAEAWGFGGDSAERLRYAIDPRWRGEKPRSYWYDANGNRTAYSGLIRPEKIDAWPGLAAR